MNRIFCIISAMCMHASSIAIESGTFIGIGIGGLFDKDSMEITLDPSVEKSVKRAPMTRCYSARKTSLSGCVIVGYESHLHKSLRYSLMCELCGTLRSDAKYRYVQTDITEFYTVSRDKIMPVVGLSIGHSIDCWNIGVRGGLSFERLTYKVDGNGVFYKAGRSPSKKIVSMSPYIGVYIEHKLDSMTIFTNIDYNLFKKYKLINFHKRDNRSIFCKGETININFSNYSTHKRPSVRISIGLKKHIRNLL